MNTPPHADNDSLTSFETHQSWSDRMTLELIEAQVGHSMRNLDETEQAHYLALGRRVPQQRQQLQEALQRFKAGFEQQALEDLRRQLAATAGQSLDPMTTYLHTYTLEVQREFPHQEIERIQTRTLWQAALDNFGFNISLASGSGEAFLRASHINRQRGGGRQNLLAVEQFVEIVRTLDLGKRLQERIGDALAGALSPALADYQDSLLQLAMLDAYRRTDDHEFNREQYQALLDSYESPGALQWRFFDLKLPNGFMDLLRDLALRNPIAAMLKDYMDQMNADRASRFLSGNQLPLPFFVIEQHGTVFSYFPERPGGAWRCHSTVELAVDALRQQIHQATGINQLHWLCRWLPLDSQQALAALLKPDNVERNKLNPLALWLYDTLSSQPSPQVLEMVESPASPWRRQSLLDTLTKDQQATIGADISLMAISNNRVDFATFKQGLLYVASETLELLTLPLPGGVTGLNRAMLTATFASLGFQTVSALESLAAGRSSETVQALTDILDLVVGARLQGVGARLSARRSRQLVAALGHSPHIARQLATRLDSQPWSDLRLVQHLLPADHPLPATHVASVLHLSGCQRPALEATWHSNGPPAWQLLALLEPYGTTQQVSPDATWIVERFPGLAPAAVRDAFGRHPALRQLRADEVIDPAVAADLLQLQVQSRTLHALHALVDDRLAFNADAQSLCCQLLVSDSEWPATVAIRIEEDLRAPMAEGFPAAPPVELYASGPATNTLRLTRRGGHYLGLDGQPTTLLQALLAHGAPWLSGHDTPASLREHLLGLAGGEPARLAELLAPAPLQRVARERLAITPRALPPDTPTSPLLALGDNRYAVIDGLGYPIQPAPDASTPDWPVWRLLDDQNKTAAAIVQYRGHWYYAQLPGAGGMRRGRLQQLRQENEQVRLQQQRDETQRKHEHKQRLDEAVGQLAATARELLEITSDDLNSTDAEGLGKLVVLYWKAIRQCTSVIDLGDAPLVDVSLELRLSRHVYRLQCLQKILLSQDLNFSNEVGELVDDPYQGEHARYRQQRKRLLQHLDDKRSFIDRHQAYLDEIQTRFPGEADNASLAKLREDFPATPQLLLNARILFRMDLLIIGNPDDSGAPIAFSEVAAEHMCELHDTLSSISEQDSVPDAYLLPLLDDLQRQLQHQSSSLTELRASSPPPESKLIDEVLEDLEKTDGNLQSRLNTLFEAIASNELLALDTDAIDHSFLPALDASRPQRARRRLINVKRQGRSTLKLGNERVDERGQLQVEIAMADIGGGSRLQRYAKANDGQWQTVPGRSAPPLRPQVPSTSAVEAATLLGQVQQHIDNARKAAGKRNYSPDQVTYPLEQQALALEQRATRLQHQDPEKAGQLMQAVQRLRNEGEHLRIQLYKSPDVLDIARLLYLIKHRQVRVTQTSTRAPRGKGQNKHFLDVYRIHDREGEQAALWEAHFHYDAKGTHKEHFQLKGGHLKTLAQARLGASAQAQAEREGRPHVAIWREAFSPQAARQLFEACERG